MLENKRCSSKNVSLKVVLRPARVAAGGVEALRAPHLCKKVCKGAMAVKNF